MTSRTWHKGPPPHVGWWNASVAGDLTAWRWWNGEHWSIAAYKEDSLLYVEDAAAKPGGFWHQIEWTDYYPKNARVPRIDPSKGKAK